MDEGDRDSRELKQRLESQGIRSVWRGAGGNQSQTLKTRIRTSPLAKEETISLLPDSQLSAHGVGAALSSLRQQGWCVLRGLVLGTELQSVRSAVIEMHQDRNTATPSSRHPEIPVSPWQRPSTREVRPVPFVEVR